MNTSADNYFINGCGRCDKYQTSECKVHRWSDGLSLLRSLLQESLLKEECKWGSPCYTYEGKNVVMIGALNDYFSLGFFEGHHMSDPNQLLVKQGNYSKKGRIIKFTSVKDVEAVIDYLPAYINEAILCIRKPKDKQVDTPKLNIPDVLLEAFQEDEAYRDAFNRLTPGRQRSYLIHIDSAKQETTKRSRIAKMRSKVLTGKGYNERV